jgi:hypothetical protein
VDVGQLRILLEEKLRREGRVDRFDVSKANGQQPMRASVRQIRRGTQVASVVLAFSR